MAAKARKNTEQGVYELGDTIDGVFVPFYTLPVSHVDTLVQAGKNAAENAGSGTDEA